MNDDQQRRNENSDVRTKKITTFYDDLYTPWQRYITEKAGGFEYLAIPYKKWRLPKGVNIRYSTVSNKHKEARKRRQNNVFRNGRKGYGR